jgi:lipoprotein-anchoring transpeptidase ErfK/SrfK
MKLFRASALLLLWSFPFLRAENPPASREQELRLQIFLDQNHFGPGKLDGRQGEFTQKALARAAQAKATTEETLKGQSREAALVLWTDYTVRASDPAYVGDLPEKPEEQAKLPFLPYQSLGELVAERFHTDLDYLRELNAGQDLDKLQPGAVLKVPAVEPFPIESIFKDPKSPESGEKPVAADPSQKTRRIAIHRAEHILEVWENEALISSFPVSVGPPENETPAGEHSIKSITWRPAFRYDKQMLKEGVRGGEAHLLPPGPNNPVGIVWIQTSRDGIGIHGTNDPDLIGRNISSGCIRLSNWDALSLARLVAPGCRITID